LRSLHRARARGADQSIVVISAAATAVFATTATGMSLCFETHLLQLLAQRLSSTAIVAAAATAVGATRAGTAVAVTIVPHSVAPLLPEPAR
jgi:hypothetical protein